MLTREILGQRIAEQRRRANLTQEQLAAAIGLERTAITRIEQGRQGVDTLLLSAIAEKLGLEPAVFFEPSEEEPFEALLRAPGAERDEIHQRLVWLQEFVRDYLFLQRLTSRARSE